MENRSLFPVYVRTVGIGRPSGPDADNVVVAPAASLGWVPPWEWYPIELPHWGIAASPDEAPRAWFAGEPQGQERRVWEHILSAVGRQQRVLSPLAEDTIRGGVRESVRVAVLTTPG